FKKLTDHKKEVTDDDIYTIVMEIKTDSSEISKYKLESFQVHYGSNDIPTATVSLKTPEGEIVQSAKTGKGSVEALYNTLSSLIKEELNLLDYQINSVGGGKDALAESHVQMSVNGQVMNGRGTAQDVIEASANAYINAVNRYIIKQQSIKEAVN